MLVFSSMEKAHCKCFYHYDINPLMSFSMNIKTSIHVSFYIGGKTYSSTLYHADKNHYKKPFPPMKKTDIGCSCTKPQIHTLGCFFRLFLFFSLPSQKVVGNT